MMQPADQGIRHNASNPLNWARDRRITFAGNTMPPRDPDDDENEDYEDEEHDEEDDPPVIREPEEDE
jgi:hypothetical protein